MKIVSVTCPRCHEEVRVNQGCRHLRWMPVRGGPIEFAKSVLAATPREGLRVSSIPAEWWEAEFNWLLDRIMARLDVVDGYCFGDQDEVDRLCMDIWHRLTTDSSS